ncbi:PDZ domain-containing protein [Compostibacter hankyongensis]|uniref:PDZ domain-containing protein n=2 Tax=Compostibacter hankyongensis TaxID=1007089 RepID=A0ABP8FDI4_9BACT
MLVLAVTGLTAGQAWAQQDTAKGQDQYQEIIIRRKGNAPPKMTIQIDGDSVLINGKKPGELKNGDVTVIQRKGSSRGGRSFSFREAVPHGGPQGLSIFPRRSPDRFPGQPHYANKALLGVFTSPPDGADKGARVEKVQERSAADTAGLQEGDLITGVDDQAIQSPEDLVKAIGGHKPGDKITLSYTRDGAKHTATATLGENEMVAWSISPALPRNPEFHFYPMPRMNEEGDPFSFNWMNDDTPQLGMRIEDAEKPQGAKISSVLPGSLAEKAGFQRGDVITRFGDKSVSSAEAVMKALHEDRDKDKIDITVDRGGKAQTFSVKLNHPKKSFDL